MISNEQLDSEKDQDISAKTRSLKDVEILSKGIFPSSSKKNQDDLESMNSLYGSVGRNRHGKVMLPNGTAFYEVPFMKPVAGKREN